MKLTKALRYTIIFAIIGLLTSFLVVYVQRNILNTYDQNLPYITLGEHINNKALKAHLWFEELLAGDESLDFNKDVLTQYSSAKAILQGAYDGKETEIGAFKKIDDEETRAILKKSIIDIENLASVTQELWEAHKNESTIVIDSVALTAPQENENGEALAAKFDVSFKAFQASMDNLVKHVQLKTKSDTHNLSYFSWISILLVVVSFSVLCTLIYKLQYGNDKLEEENNRKLKEEIARVGTLSHFVEAVSAGDYNIEIDSVQENDNLTGTLVKMRDKLKQNAEEDKKRNWTTTGLAQIGDILRGSALNSSELYDSIIKFVVKYTKSNQGGLFIYNEEEGNNFLELAACYAFERKKYLTKKVEPGDGLVGQCFLEGERIYLREVPEEYVSITSGLGGSKPNALLMVPLKVNGKIFGVIELASFHPYHEHEMQLVEKFAENIASTISTVRVNETTRILLQRTQEQTEQMKSQEEEIRQNMEELEATQEEMRRKQTILEEELLQSQKQSETLRMQEKKLVESQDTLQAIVDNIPRAIFWKDKDLNFIGANKIFASIAGLSSPKELIGKSDFDMAWRAQAEAYRKDDLEVMASRKAKLDIEEVNINSDGAESWVLTSKVPIVNENDKVVAILGMFEDITKRKMKEAEVASQLREREQALKELDVLRKKIQTQ